MLQRNWFAHLLATCKGLTLTHVASWWFLCVSLGVNKALQTHVRQSGGIILCLLFSDSSSYHTKRQMDKATQAPWHRSSVFAVKNLCWIQSKLDRRRQWRIRFFFTFCIFLLQLLASTVYGKRLTILSIGDTTWSWLPIKSNGIMSYMVHLMCYTCLKYVLIKFSYPKIGDASFKCALWTFKQHLALKCECVMELLLFCYKRLCTVHFGIRPLKGKQLTLLCLQFHDAFVKMYIILFIRVFNIFLQKNSLFVHNYHVT